MENIKKFLNLAPNKPRWVLTSEGFLRCRARVLAERVMPYSPAELGVDRQEDKIDIYVPAEEITSEDTLKSIEGVPVLAGYHKWLVAGSDNVQIKDVQVGSVAGAAQYQHPYLVVDLLITDKDVIDRITKKEIGDVSSAYTANLVYEDGEFDGQKYNARQHELRFNHIAIIPPGEGRAGEDVKILNKPHVKENEKMTVKIQLQNKQFVEVPEESAVIIQNAEAEMSSTVESTINELEAKNAELAAMQAEVEQLKGELEVYKKKLDELLSSDAVEKAAAEMIEEANEGEEIVDASTVLNEDGTPMDEEEKGEFMNSCRGLFGGKLKSKILNAIGIDTSTMSVEVMNGAFKGQLQVSRALKKAGKPTTVAGATMIKNAKESATIKQRTPLERLGFKVAK